MPLFESGDVSIYYETLGVADGPPLLLLAPGGLRLSRVENWSKAPWDPIDALGDRYRIVAMDQRNTGRSYAPITAAYGWADYTADQLALMDHLGLERFGVIGMCIGGGFGLRLVHTAPDRVEALVAMQPIGLHGNRDTYRNLFAEWRAAVAADHPEASEADWDRVWSNLFGSDRLLWTIPDEAIETLAAPVLVLLGDDEYHPTLASREVAARAPAATLVERWKEPADVPAARQAVDDFLAAHLG
jgi:pimeloyl-ACP methyl ester carboxylesterase